MRVNPAPIPANMKNAIEDLCYRCLIKWQVFKTLTRISANIQDISVGNTSNLQTGAWYVVQNGLYTIFLSCTYTSNFCQQVRHRCVSDFYTNKNG